MRSVIHLEVLLRLLVGIVHPVQALQVPKRIERRRVAQCQRPVPDGFHEGLPGAVGARGTSADDIPVFLWAQLKTCSLDKLQMAAQYLVCLLRQFSSDFARDLIGCPICDRARLDATAL